MKKFFVLFVGLLLGVSGLQGMATPESDTETIIVPSPRKIRRAARKKVVFVTPEKTGSQRKNDRGLAIKGQQVISKQDTVRVGQFAVARFLDEHGQQAGTFSHCDVASSPAPENVRVVFAYKFGK